MHRMTASRSHEHNHNDDINAPQDEHASARSPAGRKRKVRDDVESKADDYMLELLRSIESK